MIERTVAAAFLAAGLGYVTPEFSHLDPGTLVTNPVIRWSVRLAGTPPPTATRSEPAAPVVDGQRIFVGYSGTNDLLILDRNDGQLISRMEARAPVVCAPHIDADHLIFSDSAGYTFGYRREPNGWSPIWEHFSGAPIVATPTVANGTVFVANVSDTVYALDVGTGALKWRHQHAIDVARTTSLELFAAPAPAVDGDMVYAGFSDGFLVGLGRNDGTPRWQVEVGEGTYPDLAAPALAIAGGVVVGGFSQPLLRIDPSNQAVTWRIDIGSASPFAAVGETLFHGGADGKLRRIDARSGVVTWEWDSALGGTLGRPQPTAIGVLVPSGEGSLYLIDAENGRLEWTFSPGVLLDGIAGAPAISGADVFVVTNGGMLYALRGGPESAVKDTPDWVSPGFR